jgi:hypothetical protein
MKPENGILKTDAKHIIENKILYQMHFLVFDKKFRGVIYCKLLKKNSAGNSVIPGRNSVF